jgi:hypothetical protein
MSMGAAWGSNRGGVDNDRLVWVASIVDMVNTCIQAFDGQRIPLEVLIKSITSFWAKGKVPTDI